MSLPDPAWTDPAGNDARAEARDLFATNAIGLVSFTILVWDHLLTFSDEVRVIWRRPKGARPGLLIYLFIIVSSIAPFGFTVQLCSFLLPPSIWTPEICARYVVFEGCMTVTGLGLVALMMMLRVYALYGQDKRILAFLASLFVFQFTVQGWLLAHAMPVPHSKGITPAGCSMLFRPEVGYWATASAWFPIVYDSVVFALTLYKTFSSLRRRRNRPTHGDFIMWMLLRDGALYFLIILMSNIPLVIMIASAPPGIRNIAAQWAFLITVMIMCRITLSLRNDDTVWGVGTTATQFGHTTLFFNDPSQPGRAQHKIGDSRARILNHKGVESSFLTMTDGDEDEDIQLARNQFQGRFSTSSSNATLTPPRHSLPRASTSETDCGRPSPIIEEDDMDSESEYFDPRRHRRRRAPDEESDIASSRVVEIFRTYSMSSLAEVAAKDGSRNTVDDRRYDTF
ncbi:hypothetical protein BKA62DRAFT_152429 [Auriculariales sp. MPI-PUGE-AT-0066]|nr:hypothetical protein BKA62DRAFT_152429 [Auriculariales sp. MPI-PUGE-AT-0066]